MRVFKADCPYCKTRSVAFTIKKEECWRAPIDPQRFLETRIAWTNFEHTQHQMWLNSRVFRWDTFAICGQCNRGIVATFSVKDKNDNPATASPSLLSHDCIAPSAPDTGAPDHTPENVARFFKQGKENLCGNWDAAGSMFRKALEAALKNKFPDIDGNLYERIKKVNEKGGLTPDMAKWAHQIRRLGNDAAHEEEPFSERDALDLHAFTDLFLRYLFTLPGMLEEARKVAPRSEVPPS